MAADQAYDAENFVNVLRSMNVRAHVARKWRLMLADKGYGSNAIRRQIETTGAAPNIPPKSNRRWKPCFSPVLYKGRNAIERMFGRLKDFRRISTRYDRSATNYLAAVCIAATVSY